VQDYEFFKIQKYTNGHFKDFFENGEPKFKEKENLQIPLKKKFLDKINFSIADVTLDYEKIEPENSLVSIRNFLPYLGSRSNVIELIKNLGEHLKSGSNVMVGNFDHKGLSEHRINLKELLEIAGFRSTKVENLYEKI
jgi:hypothetical protein